MMKLLGAAVAILFAAVIPLWYHLVSVAEIRDAATIEAAFLAKSVERVIQQQPEIWEFEDFKLQELLAQPAPDGTPRERVIRTTTGRLVAKSGKAPPPPAVAAIQTLFDSGRPAGTLEIRASIRTPLVFTVMLGFFTSLLGGLFYYVFRTYPVRKIESTLAELERAEAEQRLSREIAERLAREASIIAEISRLIGSTLKIDEVYQRFAAEAGKLLAFDSISVNLYDAAAGTLRVAYTAGREIDGRRQGDTFPLRGTISEPSILTQTSACVQPADVSEELGRFPGMAALFRSGLRSVLCIPLVSRGDAVGVLHFRSLQQKAYSDRDLRMAERIGFQIAGAIANAQLFAVLEEAERSLRDSEGRARALAYEVSIIAEISRLIGSTLEIDEVYGRFAAEAERLLPFDSITVNLYDAATETLRVAYTAGQQIDGRRQGDAIPLPGTIGEPVIRTQTPLSVQPVDVDAELRRYPGLEPVFCAGLRSILCVPLVSRGEVVGLLYIRSRKPQAYGERDLRMAERIGMQVAGAMANARLFSELRKAERSLRESESRFRALVEEAAVGVAEVVVETGRFLTVNRRLCEMLGRSEQELLASSFGTVTHPEDVDLHRANTARLLAGEISHYSLEKRYLTKDGAPVWASITVSPLWKPGERPERSMVVVEDISGRKRMEAALQEMSLRDQLTGLYNRRGFLMLAEQQLSAADRSRMPLALTFIDCDRLKWINDTLGHQEGDRSLVDTATVLRQTFRESDIVARLGGDEFAVLSLNAGGISDEDLSGRLRQHIDALNAASPRPYRLSLSWGMTLYDPARPVSLDQLISAADERMYRQKKAKCEREG